MLRTTTARTFSTSQLSKVLRAPGGLYILTCKCASRHNGVQFFISPLASWLRTRRFSEPTFRPSGAPNHWKNTVNRDFPTFSRICIFFLLTLSLLLFFLLIFLFSLPLPCSAFHLPILSEVWLLNFLRKVINHWQLGWRVLELSIDIGGPFFCFRIRTPWGLKNSRSIKIACRAQYVSIAFENTTRFPPYLSQINKPVFFFKVPRVPGFWLIDI